MIEVWKDIKGYEGKYKISNAGKVKHLTYAIQQYEKEGQLMCNLRNEDGTITPASICRLVAEAFIPNPEGKEVVRHRGDIYNNKVNNLEWVSIQEYLELFFKSFLKKHEIRRRKKITKNKDVNE